MKRKQEMVDEVRQLAGLISRKLITIANQLKAGERTPMVVAADLYATASDVHKELMQAIGLIP